MLTKLEIKNYKSICNASIELSPFTLLIGANGTGKTNLISLLRDLSKTKPQGSAKSGNSYVSNYQCKFQKHFSCLSQDKHVIVENSKSKKCLITEKSVLTENPSFPSSHSLLPELVDVRVFDIDPFQSGKDESLVSNPTVHENGAGVVQVLDALKTGDREDLFNTIEQKLGEYIPEIEKLSFIPGQATKKLQVRERHLPNPIPVEILSEGTRLVLTILTILYQEDPPSIVCIEEIDRGLHPRLFQKIIELCHDLSRQLDIQIIATTHNPYILDEFIGNESAVVIVEKKDGCTTFTTLTERLTQIETNGDDEMPLGHLWYSGLVGGVPRR